MYIDGGLMKFLGDDRLKQVNIERDFEVGNALYNGMVRLNE